MKLRNRFFFIAFICILSACNYKQNIMFSTENEVIPERFKGELTAIEDNYRIAVNDFIKIEVYTNKGERIIDPDYELLSDLPQNTQNFRPDPTYLIFEDGYGDLPIVGRVPLKDLTLDEAKELLEKEYATYYKDPYVIINYVNKRVTVIGGPNGGQIIPLENQRMTLLDVIALAGGVDNDSNAKNIRLIRGELSDPLVMVIDLSTIEGMKKSNLYVQPNDVIYIEPVRRPVAESTKDFLPLITAFTGLITLMLVIQQL